MTAAAGRTRLLARLHALKREQGLDDDLYRDKLEALTGQRSAAGLGEAALEDAVRRFGQAARQARLPPTRQARLIQAQWISLYNLGLVGDPGDAAILAFIRRQTKLDAAVWLTSQADVERVVEALKDWMARDGGVDWKTPAHGAAHMALPAFKVCAAQWRKLAELGAASPGKTWNGNDRHWYEGLHDYARTVTRGGPDVTVYGNRQWAGVSKALGRKLRAALAAKRKEKAA